MNECHAAVMAAREQLCDLTPLLTDCGALCGAACCHSDADGQGGVYLFPGEETLYAGVPWAKVTPCELEGADAHILLCNGTCERALRPLGCRIFPLTPVLRRSGWGVRMDWRAWAMCPLMRYGTKGLNPAFVQAVEVAMREIARSEEGADFLRRWQRLESRFRHSAL